MSRSRRPLLALVPIVVLAAAGAAACGEEGISVPKNSAYYGGAAIFAEHCSGCHTLSVDGTQGSATNVRTREYKDGPNFDQRKENLPSILYAIHNGGFSSGPMPQNIVTGAEAEAVAKFVAKYSGSQAKRPPGPGASQPSGFPGGTGPAGATGGGQPAGKGTQAP